MSSIIGRVCYKNGIVKEENKVYELHKMCDCDWCKNKYMNRKRRNCATAYAEKESDIERVKKILQNWTCKDKTKDLPTEYLTTYSIIKQKVVTFL